MYVGMHVLVCMAKSLGILPNFHEGHLHPKNGLGSVTLASEVNGGHHNSCKPQLFFFLFLF